MSSLQLVQLHGVFPTQVQNFAVAFVEFPGGFFQLIFPICQGPSTAALPSRVSMVSSNLRSSWIYWVNFALSSRPLMKALTIAGLDIDPWAQQSGQFYDPPPSLPIQTIPHKLRYHDTMAAHLESFAKMKVHRAGRLTVKGNEAAKAQFALTKSMLVVPNHLDYHGTAGGFQVDLLHGLPRDWGYTDQPVVLPVLNMGTTSGTSTATSFWRYHCKVNSPSIGQLPLMHLIWSQGLVYVEFA